MTIHSFDQLIDRKNTHSIKWDTTDVFFGATDVLPFWVADMDFLAPPNVLKAIDQRVKHGVLGYTVAGNSTAHAVQSWVKKRHQWAIQQEWISYSPGIVFAISMAIQAYTQKGDAILIQPPVYTPFFEMVKLNDRQLVESPLRFQNGRYEIDFTDLEEKLATGVKMMILCSPHNPVGRVWTQEELTKIAKLCKKYHVLILSDEIHSDLVYKPFVHTPISSLSEDAANRTITCIAPSKTFNIPGLQASAIIIPNQDLREQYEKQQKKQGFFSLSTFAIIGLESAYLHGEEWLEELLVYLKANIDFTKDFFNRYLPHLPIVEPEGTYLLWIDCRSLNQSEDELHHLLLNEGKIAVERGSKYGEKEGNRFIRLNIGCPRKQLEEGLNRIRKAFSTI
ncbi:pyridoxal phosphate-dependent aminotransferase [Priestia megaterium]|nr:pyridoxal phosphate-dependent aminotransferase [Priestia megaterium]